VGIARRNFDASAKVAIAGAPGEIIRRNQRHGNRATQHIRTAPIRLEAVMRIKATFHLSRDRFVRVALGAGFHLVPRQRDRELAKTHIWVAEDRRRKKNAATGDPAMGVDH
jgi:hypothetical protein